MKERKDDMLQNQELASQVLDMIETALEASILMTEYLENEKRQEAMQTGAELCCFMREIYNVSGKLKEEENALNLPAASRSVEISATRIVEIIKEDLPKARHKIEFELIPLLEEMRINFYYWGMVYPNEEKIKKYREQEMAFLAKNHYQEEAERSGKYKYELSISVRAYNKLEYTRQCVNSLLENLPEGISYEIILVNHGSNDGTKEFFESVHPDKQLDIAVNGGGAQAVRRIAEGRFLLGISNDVIVTKNAIHNLYECISSDEKIAWAVPATSNVSNLQALVSANYTNKEEMEVFARENNVPDPYRWEQRVRLCDPIAICRQSFFNEILDGYFFVEGNKEQMFPDDKRALFVRRNGYKMYLVKNAYCHHFGSVTLKDETTEETYIKGRRNFKAAFGIDPWSTGFCYSYALFERLKPMETGAVRILGINCGLGSNPLKIKEELKERVHNEQVYIKNLSMDKNVLEDLRGVSDEAFYISSYGEVGTVSGAYDYIISEDFLEEAERVLWYMGILRRKCRPGGKILLDIPVETAIYLKENVKARKWCKAISFIEDRAKQRIWAMLCC